MVYYSDNRWNQHEQDNGRIGVIKNRLKKERIANAKLIAEAPELLNALIKMCEFHENNGTWDKVNNGYYEAKSIINELTGTIWIVKKKTIY